MVQRVGELLVHASEFKSLLPILKRGVCGFMHIYNYCLAVVNGRITEAWLPPV